jgi:hypothetical protein
VAGAIRKSANGGTEAMRDVPDVLFLHATTFELPDNIAAYLRSGWTLPQERQMRADFLLYIVVFSH